jgi:phosphohistidine phosphatase
VERVAARAAAAGVQIGRVYHSGYRRAEQSAALLARTVGAAEPVAKRNGLAPEDAVEPVARWLLDPVVIEGQGGLALVGHLPFLGLLAARLVAGRADTDVLVFEPATLVKLLPRRERDGYAIAWALAAALA